MGSAVSGIVLAGGAGRRMGTNKALLQLGGRTLLENAVDVLLTVSDDVVVAGGPVDRRVWPALRVPVVPDRFQGRGPLAGLDAGLRAVKNDSAIAVACDMPFLNPELLRFLAGQIAGHDAVVPVCGGRRHPLHGVYSRTCLPVIEELLQGGGGMNDLLSRVKTRVVPQEEVLQLDPEGLSCLNVNYPEDLDRARVLWERRRREVAAP